MCIPPNVYNKGSHEVKLSKEPLGRMKANSNMDQIQIPWSNQAVNNSSKMVGMMEKSAFGGLYHDMNMKNSVRRQEGQVSLDVFLKNYFAQVCDFYILIDVFL